MAIFIDRWRAAPRAGRSRPAHAVCLGAVLALFCATPARGTERFTVCSITINSEDEVRLFRKRLPESQFEFVELANATQTTPDGKADWFQSACRSGVRCDVLILSGHFANTYAGSTGTTFAGSSELSLSLEELGQQSCDQSCPGILSNPLEVFLFGCRTLATSLDAEALPPADLALFSSHHVPPRAVERIIEDVSYGGEDTSNRARMGFVFSGVPRLYGFDDVAPTGANVVPRLDGYLQNLGDYAKHLRQLQAARDAKKVPEPNLALERSLEPSTFRQSSGLDLAEHAIETRACFLESARNPVLTRLEHMERLLEEPGFVAYMRAMGSFFRGHDPASLAPAEVAVLERIRSHAPSRAVVSDLVRQLENPILRHEMLRVSSAVGWIAEDDALALQREIVLQLLEPPIYGERRDLICGIKPDVIKQFGIRAGDVSPKVYRDEFGIQALGCLKPADEEIHRRLSASLSDSREWIARLSAIALRGMIPVPFDAPSRPAVELPLPGL